MVNHSAKEPSKRFTEIPREWFGKDCLIKMNDKSFDNKLGLNGVSMKDYHFHPGYGRVGRKIKRVIARKTRRKARELWRKSISKQIQGMDN